MSASPPSQTPILPGEILAGKYRVERVLGVGGMGVVVAATHLQLEQLVALKFVLPTAVLDDIAVERFLREARAAVRLKSDHVTKVLDVGTLASGAPYMVMEYLEGQDLGSYIHEKGALPVAQVAEFVLQACEALAEAHSLGIVHRDLKPQNLFVTRSVGGKPKIKVLDFGISKLTAPGAAKLTQTSNVMGSPLYMAPEQMRSSKNADIRIDVWALGIVIYELLTGTVPFEADTMPELCLKVVQDEPRPIRELRADVPEGMIEVIERCLQKDPEKRYANAAEIASALEPFAPHTSGETAERARMAMSLRAPTARLPSYHPPAEAPAPRPEIPGTVVSEAITATKPREPTPAAGTQPTWGTTASAPAPSRAPMLALGAVAAVAVVAALFFALRKPEDRPAPSPITAAPSATPAPTPTPTHAPEPIVAPAEPTTMVSAAPPASASSSPVASVRKTPAPLPGKPRPASRDDDIPSVR